MAIHVVRQRGTRLGPANRWLIDDVRKRVANWEPWLGQSGASAGKAFGVTKDQWRTHRRVRKSPRLTYSRR
jgi:hypothetical protein